MTTSVIGIGSSEPSNTVAVAVSKPMTARFPVRLPFTCRVVADESALTLRWGRRFRPPFGDLVTQLAVVWALLGQRHRVDAMVAGRYADLLALLQALLPVGRRPLLLLDNEWVIAPRPFLRRVLVRLVRRLTARGAARLQVFCEAEADCYAEHFGISRDKFVWIPYCPPDAEVDLEVSEGNYVFSGGVHERDWITFAEAVKDIPVEVRIAAPPEHVPEALRSSNMVFLGRIPRAEYMRQLAGCKLLVLSVTSVVRFPGVITYAYAMRLGKCVLINEPLGARSYISDGVTGRIVASGDATELREAAKTLLEDDALRQRLGRQARSFAERELTADAYWARVSRAVSEVVGQAS